ncbi:SDR family NAD(P)-dependent oxidoreductase [Solwaraspora sp. WMMD937]|uniref:SDR family NAD(P)-dependent oxidoreductase n=1 Tax=Solwaraspora sp. WMMD937 TaxID=3016090 RepID=UPI00249CB3EA|nr:SDR family NAD(P)-dependent oxidoreductase [Solwaraspora sp. WMMD937]WFE20647.1 SDR family NAD(P)-dependent oxidoreductase [Solwaraspora sp. WMMD937]
MPGKFTGKVALVTGAGRGIGRATSLRFAAESARVVVNEINPDSIAETRSGRRHQVADLVAEVVDRYGPADILVDNAGGALPGAAWATVADASIEDWSGFLAFNLTSAFHRARAVLPGMLAAERGHNAGIGSISGTNGRVNGAAYAAAKAGMGTLVASIAKEYGSRGISSNGIVVGNAPFPNRTPDSSYLSGAMLPVDGGFHRSNLL